MIRAQAISGWQPLASAFRTLDWPGDLRRLNASLEGTADSIQLFRRQMNGG
jgi:hypothetical protein